MADSGEPSNRLERLHRPPDHVFRDPAEHLAERGDGRCRCHRLEFLAILKQAGGDDLAILVDDLRRQSDLGRRLRVERNPEPADIDQQLKLGLAQIRHAQRRVREIVVLEALDQPRLDQFWQRIASAKPGTSCGGENRKRCVSSITTAVGSGIAHCTLMVLPAGPAFGTARRS